MANDKNLIPSNTLSFDWSNEKVESSLKALYDYVTNLANETINWYIYSKKKKKNGARVIRILSIILASLAAILPTLSELFQSKDGTTIIRAGWTTVTLGAAGTLLLLDRFFGYSSAWMRYIVAELQVKQLNEEFQMDWETERAGWQGNPPSREQVVQMIVRCKTFANQINTIVKEETNVWVQEFQNSIKSLDDSLKTKAAETASKPGALNIIITNGDTTNDGWTLKIDSGDPEKYTGKTAAKKNLLEGSHIIKIEAIINDKLVQIEKVVNISAGIASEIILSF